MLQTKDIFKGVGILHMVGLKIYSSTFEFDVVLNYQCLCVCDTPLPYLPHEKMYYLQNVQIQVDHDVNAISLSLHICTCQGTLLADP